MTSCTARRSGSTVRISLGWSTRACACAGKLLAPVHAEITSADMSLPQYFFQHETVQASAVRICAALA